MGGWLSFPVDKVDDAMLVALVGHPLPTRVWLAALWGRGGMHIMTPGAGYNELNWHRVMMTVNFETRRLVELMIGDAERGIDTWRLMDDGRVRYTPGDGERSSYVG